MCSMLFLLIMSVGCSSEMHAGSFVAEALCALCEPTVVANNRTNILHKLI